MASADFFKQFFKGANLEIEDLYLLEKFQIEYFPGWVPERELAAVLREYPSLKRFLIKKCPGISDLVEAATAKYELAASPGELAVFEDTLIWTIADLLVYNKCPEIYDALEFHEWDFNEVTDIVSLDGKTVIEGGAGTGRVTTRIAQRAKYVFAVEPVSRLRQFIRDKAPQAGMENIFVSDGFLKSLPFPDNFADVLITSHALGWHLDEELPEFERVGKLGGTIIHCPGTAFVERESVIHETLISPEWGYACAKYKEPDGWKRKYWKQVS